MKTVKAIKYGRRGSRRLAPEEPFGQGPSVREWVGLAGRRPELKKYGYTLKGDLRHNRIDVVRGGKRWSFSSPRALLAFVATIPQAETQGVVPAGP